MAEENLKKKGTEVEPEHGLWNKLNIRLPSRSTGLFRYLRDFFTCLEFLTRIRITKRDDWYPDDFARSVPYFPVVGALTGLLMWGAVRLGSYLGFYGILLGVFLVLAELVFIGTLLYDGFMDTTDGIFSARTRERMLEIMQDSHVGANAVIGAILLILAKVALFASLPIEQLAFLLLAMYITTRTLLVIYILQFPNARPGGLGEMFKTGAKPIYLAVALVFAVLLLAGLGSFYGKLALLACVPCLGVAFYLRGVLGGLTGDTFGFLTQCGEVIFLSIAFCLLQ